MAYHILSHLDMYTLIIAIVVPGGIKGLITFISIGYEDRWSVVAAKPL